MEGRKRGRERVGNVRDRDGMGGMRVVWWKDRVVNGCRMEEGMRIRVIGIV